VKGLKTEQKRVFLGSFRSRVLNIQDEDKVVKSHRACHWKEHEITVPTVLSSLIRPDRDHLLEPEMPLKKKAQISLDEAFAFKLQDEEEEKERIIKEKAQQIEKENLAWDDVSAKIEKVHDDQEAAELKRCLEIVPDDEDDVTIDATPLSSKSLTIIDYKIYKEGRKSYFQIIREDGSSQMHYTFSKMLKNFNREDLEVLLSIVKARFEKEDASKHFIQILVGTGAMGLSVQTRSGFNDRRTKNKQKDEDIGSGEEENYKHLTEKNEHGGWKGKRDLVIVSREGFHELYIFSPG
nr:hypothetical protein [Tanacetum cinerariifolium]